jgi:hypothetical protein
MSIFDIFTGKNFQKGMEAGAKPYEANFDIFSGKNFQKGMEAGAKPYEAKYKQYAEALTRIQHKLGKDWGRVNDALNQVITAQESADRERLFKLNTPFDVKAMADHEKDLLVAILYTLAAKQANENQQAYIRSVQKYLGIKNPQTRIEDFTGIANIENIPSQKAFLQACMEFLFLGGNNTDFFEEYGESLFDHFNLNEKSCLEVWEKVLQIYGATGAQGLAEKYGYVPIVEKPTHEKLLAGEESGLEKLVIDQVLTIPAGEETVIEEKEIVLRDDIQCCGKLTLKNCVIFYNSDNIREQIRLEDNSSLVLSHCTIAGRNNPKRTEKTEKRLITGGKHHSTSKMEAENCLFLNCLSFIDNVEAHFKNSVIRYTNIPVHLEKIPPRAPERKAKIDFLNAPSDANSVLDNCLVEFDENIKGSFDSWNTWLNNIRRVNNCTFKNISDCLSMAFYSIEYPDEASKMSSIHKSYFIDCCNILDGGAYEPAFISDCLFENCSDVLKLETGSKLTICQFVECEGRIIYGSFGKIAIDHCDFINVKDVKDEDEFKIYRNWGIRLSLSKDYGTSSIIQHCNFDGINHAGFITYSFDEKFSVFSKKVTGLTIADCDFKHCVAGIIDKQNHESDHADVAVSISNCTGLENTEGGQAENLVIRHETDAGEPIGASIDEADVGARS